MKWYDHCVLINVKLFLHLLFEFNIFINYSLNVDFTNATKFIIKKGEDITDEETKKRSFRKSSFSRF